MAYIVFHASLNLSEMLSESHTVKYDFLKSIIHSQII